MFYYSGQIHIRRILNNIQAILHPPESTYMFPRSRLNLPTDVRDLQAPNLRRERNFVII